MALKLKLLACKQGQPSSTAGVTADMTPTTSSPKSWLIKTITFYSYAPLGQDIDVNIEIKKAGTVRMLDKKAVKVVGALPANRKPAIYDKEISLDLNDPDSLHMTFVSTSGTPTVDCVITGVERDQ